MDDVHTGRTDTKANLSIMKGIILRMAALGALSGFVLGMIYGVFYPVLAGWLNSPDLFATATVLGITLGILFGWLIGGMYGSVWGLVTGLCTGLASAWIILYLLRNRFPVTTCPTLFTLVSLLWILAGHLVLLFVLSPSYPTFPHWLLNLGLPFLIMASAFGVISYFVGNWTRDALSE